MLLGPQFWSNVSTTNQPLVTTLVRLTLLTSPRRLTRHRMGLVGLGWIGGGKGEHVTVVSDEVWM